MRTTLMRVALSATLLLCPGIGWADATPPATGATAEAADEDERKRRPILFYLPNRISDLLDVVRARVRLGPGVAVSARATRPVSVRAGTYGSVFLGVPGPRGEPGFNWPVGVENYAGVGVSVVGAETDSLGPGYGPLEIGAGVQAALIGFDIGIDPLELLDLVTGFLFIDLRGDDS